jgi:plasmid stabilization system protein ParE
MSQIVYSENARNDLVRFAEFSKAIKSGLEKRVIKIIFEGIDRLKAFPEIAPPSQHERFQHMRELFIPFGKNGYCVLYEYQAETGIILINAIRHAKEAGYRV